MGSMLPAEMDKNTPKILVVFLNAVEPALVILLKKPQHRLFQLPRTFAGDDLDGLRALGDRFLQDAVQRRVQGMSVGKDIVQVKF